MTQPPFDTGLLDRLMEEAGIDLLLTTSKHNVQYLLGGYRSLFFDVMEWAEPLSAGACLPQG